MHLSPHCSPAPGGEFPRRPGDVPLRFSIAVICLYPGLLPFSTFRNFQDLIAWVPYIKLALGFFSMCIYGPLETLIAYALAILAAALTRWVPTIVITALHGIDKWSR